MAKKVEGEKYYQIDGQLLEIKRQLRQENGYPFDEDELKKHLQDAIEGRFKYVGDPKSIPIKPFDPTFIGKGWTTWKGPIDGNGLSGEEDVDPRGLALMEIEISRLLFEACLKKRESSIKGEEKLRRQKLMSIIRLGGNAFLGLWEDYQANKNNSVLEWLYRTYKITFLDFMGQVLRDPNGSRGVLFLYRSDGKWNWYYNLLGSDWDASNPSACAQA